MRLILRFQDDGFGFVLFAFCPQWLDILAWPVWVPYPCFRLVFDVPQLPADRQGDKVIIIGIFVKHAINGPRTLQTNNLWVSFSTYFCCTYTVRNSKYCFTPTLYCDWMGLPPFPPLASVGRTGGASVLTPKRYNAANCTMWALHASSLSKVARSCLSNTTYFENHVKSTAWKLKSINAIKYNTAILL